MVSCRVGLLLSTGPSVSRLSPRACRLLLSYLALGRLELERLVGIAIIESLHLHLVVLLLGRHVVCECVGGGEATGRAGSGGRAGQASKARRTRMRSEQGSPQTTRRPSPVDNCRAWVAHSVFRCCCCCCCRRSSPVSLELLQRAEPLPPRDATDTPAATTMMRPPHRHTLVSSGVWW